MGYDIHWVIERRLTSGDWVASLSAPRVADHTPQGEADQVAFRAAYQMSQRNYPRFGELSGIATRSKKKLIAHPGLPEDASDYTRNFLEGDRKTISGYSALTPNPFVKQGHIPWALFQTAMDADRATSENLPYSHLVYLRSISNYIEGMMPLLGREILFGPVRTNAAIHHPEMAGMSNHLRIEMLKQLAQLTPIAGDTMRLCIAYGD